MKVFCCFFSKKQCFLLLIVSSCIAPDAHAPAFARKNYAPFSRAAAIAVATDEWRLWGSRVDDSGGATYVQAEPTMAERQQGFWQRIGEYWWEGMNAGEPDSALTGKHDMTGKIFPAPDNGRYAWSAAFISYVMRIAGAGAHFPYAPDHATYINYAARAARGLVNHPLLVAENPGVYAPRLGDLVCFGRGYARTLTFADLPTSYSFPAHCSIVVPSPAGDVVSATPKIAIIGGNVDDAVTMQHLNADAAGRLSGNREPWFVVLRVLYTVN